MNITHYSDKTVNISGLNIKQCRRCNQDLSMEMFKTGQCWVCNPCKKAYKKIQKAKAKERVVDWVIRERTRRNAKWRGKVFELTTEQFMEIRSRPCFYCGGLLGDIPKRQGGLDRIDNEKGYVLGNVLPCCNVCNSTRNKNFSVEETKAMIDMVMTMRGLTHGLKAV